MEMRYFNFLLFFLNRKHSVYGIWGKLSIWMILEEPDSISEISGRSWKIPKIENLMFILYQIIKYTIYSEYLTAWDKKHAAVIYDKKKW